MVPNTENDVPDEYSNTKSNASLYYFTSTMTRSPSKASPFGQRKSTFDRISSMKRLKTPLKNKFDSSLGIYDTISEAPEIRHEVEAKKTKIEEQLQRM